MKVIIDTKSASSWQTNTTKDTPVGSVLMAVIDSLEVSGKVTFRKS